jgi:hypothetical protein
MMIRDLSEEKAMSTATSWIEKHADVCGGDACIRRTRITGICLAHGSALERREGGGKWGAAASDD